MDSRRITRSSSRLNLVNQRHDSSAPTRSAKRPNIQGASESKTMEPIQDSPVKKRRKVQSKKDSNPDLHKRLFNAPGTAASEPCLPPARHHDLLYHRPLLLDETSSREALLTWFSTVKTKRAMPWRKPWICPSAHDEAELRKRLEQRAYEVWISEIMLQQTRVAVVIDYWNRWMAKWPTIKDLAAAESDDVLNAWRGLGYYSRATRIHEAAKLVTQDAVMNGLLPSNTRELEAKIPGVGRYTAGAISAIVFGQPVPMVDGNVLRVLSRQLGLYGNIKTDKTIIDLLWTAAAALVRAVSDSEQEAGHRPGDWGQALMELGSTVCTPKPNCMDCPISWTCRVYAEGKALVKAKESCEMSEIEDLCQLCQSFQMDQDETSFTGAMKPPKLKQKRPTKTSQVSRFFNNASNETTVSRLQEMEIIVDHARKFPVKITKKPVKAHETLVCIVQRDDGQYLIQKRPEKGLLASLWEFPSHMLLDSEHGQSPDKHRTKAISFISNLVNGVSGLEYVQYLGSVPWLFSHIKLNMHVYHFTVDCPVDISGEVMSKWVTDDLVGKESMGTGMRICWMLMKESGLQIGRFS